MSLIEIKVSILEVGTMLPSTRGDVSMLPMEIVVLTLIATAFCAFAATLYWADLQTRGLGR
jgi:hypothetical protein